MQWKREQEREEERLEFQPTVGRLNLVVARAAWITPPPLTAVSACSELLPLDVDDRITGADDDEVEC